MVILPNSRYLIELTCNMFHVQCGPARGEEEEVRVRAALSRGSGHGLSPRHRPHGGVLQVSSWG